MLANAGFFWQKSFYVRNKLLLIAIVHNIQSIANASVCLRSR